MKRLYNWALRLKSAMRSLCMRAFSLLPMKNRVVFLSFSGKSYSDNPRAISEALTALAPDVEQVWLFADPAAKRSLLPAGIRLRRINSPGAIFALATARCWVDNMPKPLYTFKRDGQFYIQTWHGDRGFKKMLYDAPDHPLGKPVLEERIADLLVSGSAFCEGTYHTGFRYFGEIARFGSPRNDVLMAPPGGLSERVKRAVGLCSGDKVLLYAPTMRNAPMRLGRKQPIQPIDLLRTLDALEARFGGRFKCLVRCHSTQLGLSGLPDSDRILDVSNYEDMAELLVVTDVLITDYSSSAGDFALTGRPIILFQEDRDGFAKSERTFYYDIASSPYVVVTGQRQLESHIEQLTLEQAQENDRQILNFFGVYETGHAARSLAEILQKNMC